MPPRLDPFWCLVTVNDLPGDFDEGVVVAEGFEDQGEEAEIDPADLQYLLSCWTWAGDDKMALAQIRRVRKTLTVEEVDKIETVTSDPDRVPSGIRPLLDEVAAGDALVHTLFAGFKRNHPPAYETAREVMQQAYAGGEENAAESKEGSAE
jgi:hypothetical protein